MTRAPFEPTFRRFFAGIGTLSLRPFELTSDVTTLHGWVTQPYARYWGLLDASVADVHAEYLRIDRSGHHSAFLGSCDGRPAFLMERYEPSYDVVVQVYDVAPGDTGMHVLVEPDVRNTKIQVLNERMGFRKHSIVDLPDKQAWLCFCTRDQYAEATRMNEAG